MPIGPHFSGKSADIIADDGLHGLLVARRAGGSQEIAKKIERAVVHGLGPCASVLVDELARIIPKGLRGRIRCKLRPGGLSLLPPASRFTKFAGIKFGIHLTARS